MKKILSLALTSVFTFSAFAAGPTNKGAANEKRDLTKGERPTGQDNINTNKKALAQSIRTALAKLNLKVDLIAGLEGMITSNAKAQIKINSKNASSFEVVTIESLVERAIAVSNNGSAEVNQAVGKFFELLAAVKFSTLPGNKNAEAVKFLNDYIATLESREATKENIKGYADTAQRLIETAKNKGQSKNLDEVYDTLDAELKKKQADCIAG